MSIDVTTETTERYDELDASDDIRILPERQHGRTDCPQCGEEFDTPGEMHKHNYDKHRLKVRYRVRCQREACSKVDLAKGHRVGEVKYCSQECANLQISEAEDLVVDPVQHPSWRICPTCTQDCGSMHGMSKHHIQAHQQRVVVQLQCENCQESYRLTPALYEKEAGRFCSEECAKGYDDVPDYVIVLPVNGKTASERCYHTKMDCSYISGNSWVRSIEHVREQGLDECEKCKRKRARS